MLFLSKSKILAREDTLLEEVSAFILINDELNEIYDLFK